MLFIAHSAEAVGTGSYKNVFQSSPSIVVDKRQNSISHRKFTRCFGLPLGG